MRIENYQAPNQQVPKPCPVGFCPKSFIAMVLGSKGSGKTNMIVHMMKEYQKFKFFDKIYVFSPTIHDDNKYAVLMDMAEEVELYDDFNNELFKEVIGKIKGDLEEYKKYERVKVLLDRLKKSKKEPELIFDDDELMELYMNDFQLPETKYTKVPYTAIVIDDMGGNKDLMKNRSPFINFALRTRHLYTSIVIGLQMWKNGLPRTIRSNLDWLVLATNKSKEVQTDVWEDFSSYASKEDFIHMWNRATVEPYSWFCVNLMVSKKYRFTLNFDEPLK